jgi:hypothetical protein
MLVNEDHGLDIPGVSRDDQEEEVLDMLAYNLIASD